MTGLPSSKCRKPRDENFSLSSILTIQISVQVSDLNNNGGIMGWKTSREVLEEFWLSFMYMGTVEVFLGKRWLDFYIHRYVFEGIESRS
jgi:hypothetical protein